MDTSIKGYFQKEKNGECSNQNEIVNISSVKKKKKVRRFLKTSHLLVGITAKVSCWLADIIVRTEQLNALHWASNATRNWNPGSQFRLCWMKFGTISLYLYLKLSCMKWCHVLHLTHTCQGLWLEHILHFGNASKLCCSLMMHNFSE